MGRDTEATRRAVLHSSSRWVSCARHLVRTSRPLHINTASMSSQIYHRSFRQRMARDGQLDRCDEESFLSTVLSAPAVWRAQKRIVVNGHTRHRHKSGPISVGFEPPQANTTLIFGPSALAASIARTATLRNTPPEMLASWGDSTLTQVEWLIEDGTTFALSQHLQALADAERTSFAGRVGAGITDLLMNALG
jgi:hypothetical protein